MPRNSLHPPADGGHVLSLTAAPATIAPASGTPHPTAVPAPSKKSAARGGGFDQPNLTFINAKPVHAAIRGMWAREEWETPANELPYFRDKPTGSVVELVPDGHSEGDAPTVDEIQAAGEQLLKLSDRQVSALLICMGKWFADGGAEGQRASTRVSVEDVLGFRGIRKHHKGGYRPEQKLEAQEDILALNRLWVRFSDTVHETVGRRRREVNVNVRGPLMYVAVESTQDMFGPEMPYAFRIQPGEWAQHYLSTTQWWTTKVGQTVMRYHPYHQRLEMRLGIYLAIQWRIRSNHRNLAQPFHLRTLLEGTKTEVPRRHPERFFTRVVQAFRRLESDGVVGDCSCLDTDAWPPSGDEPPKEWVPRALDARWRLTPPATVTPLVSPRPALLAA